MSEIDPAAPIQQPVPPHEGEAFNDSDQFQAETDHLAEGRAALDKIEAAVPELLEGRVPKALEERVFAAGFTEYAVGFNQSDGITDIEEATELLEEDGGIELQIYNLDQRFLLHDKEDPIFMYPLGYYGPRIGRFVYAIPTNIDSGEKPRNVAAQANEAFTDNVPGDLFVESEDGETVVNSKYCAGFIDAEQNFHPNAEFMKDKVEPAEIGDIALDGEVELIAAKLATPTESDETRLGNKIEAVRGFLEQEGLDIDTQTSKFEEQVRQRVDEIWNHALSEGRHQLTETEVGEIRTMRQLVEEQRAFVKHFHTEEDAENLAASENNDVSEKNAQAQVDRLFALSKDRKLTDAEKFAYRKAKQYLANKGEKLAADA